MTTWRKIQFYAAFEGQWCGPFTGYVTNETTVCEGRASFVITRPGRIRFDTGTVYQKHKGWHVVHIESGIALKIDKTSLWPTRGAALAALRSSLVEHGEDETLERCDRLVAKTVARQLGGIDVPPV